MNYNKVPFNIRNVLFISLLIPFLTFGKNSKLNSYELGLMHGVKGKFFAAKKELKKVKKLSDNYRPAKYMLDIITDMRTNKIKTKTAIFFFKGSEAVMSDKFSQALRLYSEAIKLNPSYAPSYVFRARVYIYQRQLDKALLDFNLSIKVNSKYASAYFNRGVLFRNMEKYQQAIRDFSKAINLESDYLSAYRVRGNLYGTDLRQPVKACADWKKMCNLGRCEIYTEMKGRNYCQ